MVDIVTFPEGAVEGRVVEGDDPATLEGDHAVTESGELIVGPAVVVADVRDAVGRVQEDKIVLVIVVFEQALVIELLDDHGVKALLEGSHALDQGLGAHEGATGWIADYSQARARSGEGCLVEVKEKGGPLDVGQAANGLEELPGVVDLGSRGRWKLSEFAGEFVWMVRGDAVEVDEIAVDVVHDFQAGLPLRQEKGTAPGKGFDVACAVRDVWQEALEVAGLAAGPG